MSGVISGEDCRDRGMGGAAELTESSFGSAALGRGGFFPEPSAAAGGDVVGGEAATSSPDHL